MVVSKEHFDLDYYGGPGMKYFTKVRGKDAIVNVVTYLNDAAKKAGCVVQVGLWDAAGKLVAEAEGCDVNLNVKDVHLWDGLEDPYLYKVKAVLVKDGKAVDEVGCNCGVREFSFNPVDGFHLNGRPYPLHGVSRHQDYRDLGNAISKEEHDQDMELIKEVGANTIRLAHYQHNQYFYDLCDKYGYFRGRKYMQMVTDRYYLHEESWRGDEVFQLSINIENAFLALLQEDIEEAQTTEELAIIRQFYDAYKRKNMPIVEKEDGSGKLDRKKYFNIKAVSEALKEKTAALAS